jgi:hypothetical protein
VNEGLKQSIQESGETLLNGTPAERGEVVGQVLEFAVEMVFGTKGAGAAMKAAKAGSMGSKAAKAAEIADKTNDIVKAAGGKLKQWTLGKLPKSIKGIFGKKRVPSYKHGQSDGGPGTWEHRTTPKSGAKYQEQVTGAPKDTEYVVKTDKKLSGEKKFDGYDPETERLIDAKDWDIWPPDGQNWAKEKIAKEAADDADIAKQAGCKLEWHVPTEEKAKQLRKIFKGKKIDIEIKVTPKK